MFICIHLENILCKDWSWIGISWIISHLSNENYSLLTPDRTVQLISNLQFLILNFVSWIWKIGQSSIIYPLQNKFKNMRFEMRFWFYCTRTHFIQNFLYISTKNYHTLVLKRRYVKDRKILVIAKNLFLGFSKYVKWQQLINKELFLTSKIFQSYPTQECSNNYSIQGLKKVEYGEYHFD